MLFLGGDWDWDYGEEEEGGEPAKLMQRLRANTTGSVMSMWIALTEELCSVCFIPGASRSFLVMYRLFVLGLLRRSFARLSR